MSWDKVFENAPTSWFPSQEDDSEPERPCIWPDEFAEDTPEAALRFVLEQHTWNEQAGQIEAAPRVPYIEPYVYEWHRVKASDSETTLIMEKCRRQWISWCARALELHQLGLGRCDQILAGLDYEAAAKHVWRLKFLYEGMQVRHPEWELPVHTELRYKGERALKLFALGNGSFCQAANGQAEQLTGEGARITTLEEPTKFRYLARMVSQMEILMMGRSMFGTILNLITNTPAETDPATYDWDKLISGWDR